MKPDPVKQYPASLQMATAVIESIALYCEARALNKELNELEQMITSTNGDPMPAVETSRGEHWPTKITQNTLTGIPI